VGRAAEADQDLAGAMPRIDNDLQHWPTDAATLEGAAWLLATIADTKLRNPGRAVELAEKATHLAPKATTPWRTLGIARCRAGQLKETVSDLEKSTQLPLG